METQILSPTLENLERVAVHLQSGQLAAIPTETVYGLAGHALNPEAVAQIFLAKDRPQFDPLITHIAQPQGGVSLLKYLEVDLGLVDLSQYDHNTREALEDLLLTLWPGPLTIVVPRTDQVPDLVTSGLSTVALRMPRHPIAQHLLQIAQIPLAAPSANRFGRISPTSARAVLSELQGRLTYILDGGDCEIGLESTVIAIDPLSGITLLRPGGITLEQIQQITSLPIRWVQTDLQTPVAPGQLSSHYAPSKPFILLSASLSRISVEEVKQLLARHDSIRRLGILIFDQTSESHLISLQAHLKLPIDYEILSSTGDLTEAAKTLFAKLRKLDQSAADLLLTEPCPSSAGLGYAIGDRLRRATAKR